MDEKLLSKYDAIADGLATDGIAVVDDFLSPEEVSFICREDDFKNGMFHFS